MVQRKKRHAKHLQQQAAPDQPAPKTFTKEEWWDVARRVKPSITWEEFEEMWNEFIIKKEEGSLILH